MQSKAADGDGAEAIGGGARGARVAPAAPAARLMLPFLIRKMSMSL